MGLFKKETCPVCGQPVKGISATKIKDNQALCNDCFEKIEIDFSMMPFLTVDDIKEHFVYREENLKLFEKFSTTKEIKCGKYFFREDAEMGKWYFSYEKNPVNPPLFSYDDIVDYELVEDGQQIVKGGLGAAVAGASIAGGVGAIVGSNVGRKKVHTNVESMSLRISLKNRYKQLLKIDFIPFGMKVKSGSITYNSYKADASNVISFLDTLCSKANVTMSSIRSAAVSSADEILKFKNLLDAGIITQEEFEAKKKELLGL